MFLDLVVWHLNHVRYLEERLQNGMSLAAVAGMTALLTQLDAQRTLPSTAVSIVADVAGYKRTKTFRHSVWDGYDLTHPFQDDRSIAMYGPSNQIIMDQEASLRMLPCTAPGPSVPLQSAQMVIRPFSAIPVPSGSQQTVQELATSHQDTVNAPRQPPSLADCTTGEQAVLAALHAVANYPELRGYVGTAANTILGLRTLLNAPVQPERCMLATISAPSLANDRPSTSAFRDLSPVSDVESGRKRTMSPKMVVIAAQPKAGYQSTATQQTPRN